MAIIYLTQDRALGNIHTNGIENFWSLLAHGILGTFRRVSGKHLQRYLNEFVFRFDNRNNRDLLELVVRNADGAHTTYDEIINANG